MEPSSLVATAGGLPADRERVIGELTRGREIADELRAILRQSLDAGATSATVLPARGLIEKILHSFTQSLSVLNALRESEDQVSQLVPPDMDSPAGNPEDSGESCKKPGRKDRRGCYKRRKTSETETIESSSLFEDGHAWRKYGQKVILNAKHPRNYFRCTHKFDQGCQATKYVQKIKDDPPLFRTTYHGHHTCNNNLYMMMMNTTSSPHHHHHHHISMEDKNNNSIILNFQSADAGCCSLYKPKTTSCTSSSISHPNPTTPVVVHAAVKHENKEIATSSTGHQLLPIHDHHQMKNSSSPSLTETSAQDRPDDYLMSPHHIDHHEFLHNAAVNFRYDHTDNNNTAAYSSGSEDVYSCSTASTHNNHMDHFMVDSVFTDHDLLDF